MAFDANDWFCLFFELRTLQEKKAESHEELSLCNTENNKNASERKRDQTPSQEWH